MRRLRLRLSNAAAADLIEIGQYTADHFGAAQCERYITALDRAMGSLLRSRSLGHPCDDIRPGYRRLLCGRHAIFYKVTAQTIDVIRILHERMLPKSHLDDST